MRNDLNSMNSEPSSLSSITLEPYYELSNKIGSKWIIHQKAKEYLGAWVVGCFWWVSVCRAKHNLYSKEEKKINPAQ